MSAVSDLKIECQALDNFVSGLDEQAWRKPTVFYGWTTYDEIIHNHHLDCLTLMSLRQPAEFVPIVEETMRRSREEPVYSFRAFTNETFGMLSRDEALARWRATYVELCAELDSRDPAERMAWFGPPMNLDACATARQMEVWAHGQDIYDLFGIRRVNNDGLRNIAFLGVRTFGWSFVNRKREVPAVKPYVALTAPSGALWEWNDPKSPERVTGPAEDFCHVVTQRRHVEDTKLMVTGADAREWLLIAQCFAGDPADGPPPAKRIVNYHDQAKADA